MVENSAPFEQITAPVEATPASRPTKKDPKKVAAGKALTRKNKEAREAKLKLEGQSQTQPSSLFDTASILIGSALVLYHGYQPFNAAFGKGVIRPSGYVKREEGQGGETTPPAKVKEENSIQME